ncbi:MAG: glutathione-disulfide reductase [Gammaproteobacteria bacterium]|nr:glutathione-disulfide reductase [Gammaproteobacteria bacterium]
MAFDYDLYVIGAGSGGVRAARMSASFGARVAIAEDRYLGGTCVNVGCIPKKLLVYASHYSSDFSDARAFGWDVPDPAFHWPQLIDNKDREIARLNGVYERMLGKADAELVRGRANVIDAHTVEVNGKRRSADRILIATGGWPSIPDIPGREFAISSNEAFFLKQFPKRVIVVGGSYIAVEFAGIFNGLGAETALVYRGPLFLRGFDRDLRECLAEEMRKKEVELIFNENITRIDKTGADLAATLSDGNARYADLILYATGRRPNTAGIGLEKAGVRLDDEGAIVVNDQYQSSVPSIFAIGDVTNRVNLTPVATAEGSALAQSLFGGQPSTVDYRDIPTCIFSQPSLSCVGLTEEEARDQYGDIAVYKSNFTPLRHTLTGSGERTLMKLIVDRATDRVVGAHMVGAEAGEIIQGIAIAMKAGATKAQFDATIGIHPTAAEEFVTMREPA